MKSYKRIIMTLALGLTVSLGFSTISRAEVSDNATSLASVWEAIESLSGSVKDTINNVLGGTGNDLTTTNKQVVPAINELDGEIGNLNTLTTTEKDTVVAAINEVDNHADTANKNAGTWINGQTIASGTTTKTITVSGMKGNDSIVEIYYNNASISLLKQKHIDITYTQSGENLTITFSKAIPSSVTIDKINLINP